jgi:hypothetical protein
MKPRTHDCLECGSELEIDVFGDARHTSPDSPDGIDHRLEADHVAECCVEDPLAAVAESDVEDLTGRSGVIAA